ncbi:hypothetical protein IPV08_12775 [Methylobacterium sp. SD274]|uniref:hypothetical protein n=1 Tax=Methylobacterium sp. SD274 TaxID=2782009 RepID=UPI001A96B06F|nr:hypothetical protein [Methylobacterium sp. SD274]MBO1020844.1 hypothetical protein [Methylobacterium sp. SD274]
MVEWAEEFRKLSKESSNGGKFITSRVEVARGPMLSATEPGVSKITLMACTQLGLLHRAGNLSATAHLIRPQPIRAT